MYVEQIRRAVMASPRTGLPALAEALWRSFAAGAIGEDDAQSLAELIEARKVTATPPPPRAHVGSRPRSPASIARRRRISSAGWLSPQIASAFTLSEQAALSVVAAEVARTGRCELTVGEIAARAGCCGTVVRTALREARRLGLINVEARRVRYNRNMPNVVTILSREWVAWLRIGSRGGGCRFAQATKQLDSKNGVRSAEPSRSATRTFGGGGRKDRATSASLWIEPRRASARLHNG